MKSIDLDLRCLRGQTDICACKYPLRGAHLHTEHILKGGLKLGYSVLHVFGVSFVDLNKFLHENVSGFQVTRSMSGSCQKSSYR